MTKNTAKPIRSIFLRSQIAVSLIVMGIVTVILTFFLLSLANFMDHQRIIDLSQSIETQTRIAKTSQHLQHAITQIVHEGKATGITIYDKNSNNIIVANSLPSDDRKNSWLLADKEVRKKAMNSMAEGHFGLYFINTPSRQISILPLAPPISDVRSNNVIIGAKWPTPDWHDITENHTLRKDTLWHRLKLIGIPNHKHNFHIPQRQFAGAIVIETKRNWISSLVMQGVVIIAILMALGIITVLAVLSRVLHKNVLQPIHQYTDVISARRTGDLTTRVPILNILEMDELARQWNSLLDFRDVAQGQNMVLSTLLEHVPVGIDVTDAESNIEYANPSFLKMTGYSLAEVIGKNPDTLLTPYKTDPRAVGDSLVSLANGKNWTGEITYSRKDGSDLICNTTLVPIFGQKHQLERIISVRLDITDLKNDQKTLISAKINAETADKAKSEFLTNMSHELRTPLNSIIGFSELMAAQKLGPMGSKDYVEFSKLIETSSRTLLSSINLILDLSRFDAQKAQYSETTFSLCEELSKMVESKASEAKSLGITIKRDFECNNCLIRTDQRMLSQSLNSLLCNAIRYNKQDGGEVEVSSSQVGDSIKVTITDTGIGISKENLPKITEPFYRVNSEFDRMKDGAGLGLTLAKKFADEMNIEFNIASKLGHGTTITMVFPVAQAEKAAIPVIARHA